MRRALIPVLLVALLAPVAAAGGKTYVGPCNPQQKAAFKPHRIVVTCADAGFVLRHLSWSSWRKTVAHGKGTAYVNNCKPNCANGHFDRFPVNVKLSKVVTCSGAHPKQFKRVTYTYTGNKPAGVNRTAHFARVCGR
jgi:hypothetical protein